MTAPSRSTLFISDLHLTPATPVIAGNFFRFVDLVGSDARALYILGDLFDYWIGDDDLDNPFHRSVASRLQELSRAGTKLFLLHGNRDFLIGDEFARASGCAILPDPVVMDLHGTPTLLTHGDALCTDDLEYQRFRELVRSPGWQKAFLAKPIRERRAIAHDLRQQSEASKHSKSMEIMDVNAIAVAEQFRTHHVSRMIHGHTHRPARHELVVDGKSCERWVLSDWRDTAPYLVLQDEDLQARAL
jgi:UDP-2,3-diacylglucosamine hydrolase